MLRQGMTLIELLVAVFIIAVLVAMLIPAVQAVRARAGLLQSQNNLRQIALGFHAMGDANNGNLAPCSADSASQFRFDTFVELLPFVEANNMYARYARLTGHAQLAYSVRMQTSVYVNPLDPSYGSVKPGMLGFRRVTGANVSGTSYAVNARVFAKSPRFDRITDGLSQTIMLSEHYGFNCAGTTFMYTCTSSSTWTPMQPPTFAESVSDGRPVPGDYLPVTDGTPPYSSAADGATFQLVPSLSACSPRLPNASFSGGLQVALCDGSVRLIGPSARPNVFWGMVTPSAGDLVPWD